MRIHSANAYSCDTCDKRFATKQQLGFHIVAHTTEAPHVCKTCGARFKYECSLVKHYRQHMYPSVKKEKVAPDVKPGEKAYKKIIDEYKAKRKSAPITKVEKANANDAEDSFAFPASPGPAAPRKATIMPEIVEALDQEPDEMYVPVTTKSRRTAMPEPRMFQEPTDPPLDGEYQEEQDVPPPIMIMPLDDGQGPSAPPNLLTPNIAAADEEVVYEEVVEELVWDENLGANVTPGIQDKLKDLGLQVPNINLEVNRLFPTLAEKKKRKSKNEGELPEPVELDKLAKVGIVDQFGDPTLEVENPVQVHQKKKSVPLSKKPMPLKAKKVVMTKLHKKLDPAVAPALSKSGGPPILEKISSMLHEPNHEPDEEDGPPVLTKVQPTKTARGQANRKDQVTPSTVINTSRPTRRQQATPTAVTPARLAAMKKKASPSPTKASKFKKEEGYEPYDWGFSDDEGVVKNKNQAHVNKVVAAAAKKATARHVETQRGRRSITRKAVVQQEEEEEEEEEQEEEEEPVIEKVQTPRGRGRPRKVDTQTKDVKAKPSPTVAKGRAPPPKATPPGRKAAPPKATPPTRLTRSGPSKLPPRPTPPTRSTPSTRKDDESESAVTSPKQLPLKKRPAAYKRPGTPQGTKKSAPSTPQNTSLDTSPLRKSARSQKPTEKMLEYLQDKALVGKVKTEPGTEHVVEIQVTPGKPSRIIEVTSQGKKFVRKPDFQATDAPKGKVAQTKASKAEALKEAKAKAAAMAKAKADKLKKTAIATKRRASPSPADAPAKKKQAVEVVGETPKRGRGRPRKDGTTTPKFAPARTTPESKFKERKSAAEMIEEYAANLMDDLKNKALEGDEDYDSEDEEPDPLKSSMGKRSNRSGSVSGRSTQDEVESDGEHQDLNWEHSRIIRRRASSDEEDDDEEEDIKIIRRARRASSKSPKAKTLSPARSFSGSPRASPSARKLAAQIVAVAEEEDVVTVQIRVQPMKSREPISTGVELVEDLHDDEVVENNHVAVEPAIEAAEEAGEDYEGAVQEEEVVNEAVQEEVVEEEVEEAVEEVVCDASADMAEDASEFVEETVEASGPKPGDAVVEEVATNIEEQVGTLKERIAAAQEVGTVEQAEAVVDEIRALTEQAHAAMKEVEAPQLQVESELIEMPVDEPAVVSQMDEETTATHSANILQVPDIRIQAPSPIVDQGEMGMAIETPSFEAPSESFEAPMLAVGEAQPATNGIGEELLGAINQATEEGTLTQTKTGSTVPEQQ